MNRDAEARDLVALIPTAKHPVREDAIAFGQDIVEIVASASDQARYELGRERVGFEVPCVPGIHQCLEKCCEGLFVSRLQRANLDCRATICRRRDQRFIPLSAVTTISICSSVIDGKDG